MDELLARELLVSTSSLLLIVGLTFSCLKRTMWEALWKYYWKNTYFSVLCKNLNLCVAEKENQMWCWKVECLSTLEVLNPALVYLCIF